MKIVHIHNEGKRGCGFRKQGGLYMMAGQPEASCGKLPLPLLRCPCCGSGIKQSRGWTWINAKLLFADVICTIPGGEDVRLHQTGRCMCILEEHNLPEKMGLLWIGEKFYPMPVDFMQEGFAQGVSRRISAIPRDFKLGETWVAFAHPKGFEEMLECPACDQAAIIVDENGQHTCEECEGRGMVRHFTPAIIGVFRPTRIEYIVKDGDSEEKLQKLEDRGITLVHLTWDRGEGPEETEEPDAELQMDLILEDQERADFAQDRDEDNISAADTL